MLLDALSQAVAEIEPHAWLFECANAFPQPVELSVSLGPSKKASLVFPMAPKLRSDELQPLVAAARGTSIDASQIAVTGLEGVLADVTGKVRRHLCPEAPSIHAELLQLQVLTGEAPLSKDLLPAASSAGSRTCFGLLEVVLPTLYQGGEFNLSHGAEKTEKGRKHISSIFPPRPRLPRRSAVTSALAAASDDDDEDEEEEELEPELDGAPEEHEGLDAEAVAASRVQAAEEKAKKAAQKQAKANREKRRAECEAAAAAERAAAMQRLQWAAWFGDVERTIAPVSGCPRLSLIYALHRPDTAVASSANAGSQALLKRCQNLQRALLALLDSSQFLPKGGKIGYRLRNVYLEAALAKAEDKLNEGGSQAWSINLPLKNEDAAVATVLASTGLDSKILRLACKGRERGCPEGEFYVMAKMPTKKDAEGFGHRGLLAGGRCGYGLKCYRDQLDRSSLGKESAVVGPVTWLGTHKAARNFWCRLYPEGTTNPFESIDFETAAALVLTVPPLDQRARARPTLTLSHVQPFKTAGSGGKRKKQGGGKAKGKGKGAAAEGGNKRQKRDKEEEDDDEEDEQMEAQAGRLRRREDGNEEEEDAEEEEEGRGGARGVVALTAPPVLFRPQDPSVMTAAQKRVATLNTTRKIHVQGGRGHLCDKAPEESELRQGKATIALLPGQGLKELKTAIRNTFGKVRKTKVGPLVLLDSSGRQTAGGVKTDDVVEGARVECTYIAAQGIWAY